MAIPRRFQLLLLLLLFILISLFISTASTTVQPPSSAAAAAAAANTMTPTLLATILSSLGFQELSSAAASSANNLSTATTLTIFAPTDSSLLTCPSCSTPQLLLELSLPALFPIGFLQSLIFGTKIETLAPNRCLTITKTVINPSSKSSDVNPKVAVFINGVEIKKPDMFNNGHVIIHGVQGFISHLSPLSCNIERMTSLTFPNSPPFSSSSVLMAHASPTFSIMRLMIKDAVIRLRTSGYSVVSLALRVKYHDIADLKSATVFALEDSLIFSGGGNAYLANFRYHVVPNRRLTAAELVSLPPTSVLPTLDAGNSLVVTTPSGGGPLAPMKINYVKVTTIDLLHNSRIVVHAISSPFPHMVHHFSQHLSAFDSQTSYDGSVKCDNYDVNRGTCGVNAEVPAAVHPTVQVELHDGL